MNICDDNHPEIVYTERKCPLCEAIVEIEGLKEEIHDLEEQQ